MRLYAALLRLYPASFRDEYGYEMRAVFSRHWRQAGSAVGRLNVLTDVVLDTVGNAPAAHLDLLRQDLRSAFQTIRRTPGLSLTLMLVTAIGVGATTAALAVADHVLIRPLPYPDSDRLVTIWQAMPNGKTEASPANLRDWRDNAHSFESLAAFALSSRNLIGRGEPIRLDGAGVTGNLFATLGVPPLLGRVIVPNDDLEVAQPTALISERLWRERFASDPNVLGQEIALDNRTHIIIGVMPAAFQFPSRDVDYWIPIVLRPAQYIYGNPYLHGIARLRSGVSREQANAELAGIAKAAARQNPEINPRVSVTVSSLRDEVSRQSRMLLWILVAASGGLLLIACTNLANLLLTRGLARHKELAVRAALGASRTRLMRTLVTENALLAAVGGFFGIGLAAAGIPTLVRLVPAALPTAAAPSIDLRFLTTAVAATSISALTFGVVPALRTSRQADARALRDGGRSGTGHGTSRLRSALVVTQISLSVLLLVASGLLLRAMLTVQAIDPGFVADGVLTLRTTLPPAKYDSVRLRQQFYTRVLDGVRALPGVSAAGYITGLPMVNRGGIWVIQVPGREAAPREQRLASLRWVTPDFFTALRIPLQGRDVADTDVQAARPAAIVSTSLARRFWPGQSALGQQLRVRGIDWTIVGIAGDVRVSGLEQSAAPQIYLPVQQIPDRGFSAWVPRDLAIRSSQPPANLLPAIRRIVASADPQQPISDVRLLSDIVEAETAPRRVQVRVLGAFAGIAFLLAGIGLHGLVAHQVSSGTRELAVRAALGAERHTLLVMVMHRGMRLAVAGVAIGAVLAIGAGGILRSLLAGISSFDTLTFAGAVLLVIVAAAMGTLLPALRAMRIDPAQLIVAD